MIEKSSKIIEDFQWLSPPGDESIALWFWIGLLLLFLAAGAFIVLRKKRNLAFLSPASSPHENARRALREMSALLAPGNDRKFVRRLSQILRVYIHERFGVRAPFRATEEFLNEARASLLLSEEDRERLSLFLASCDRVKFARYRASLDEMQHLFRSAEDFVEATVPAETVNPEVAR
jgi:LPXTG-motif cell wall-anchored protein